jgi:hypothetical protein
MLLIKIVVALLVIIGMLSYFGYKEYKAGNEKPQFPPFISKCPDYWEVVGENRCRNVNKLGVCLISDGTKDSDVMDFNLPIFEGKKGLYYKCSWAQKCRVPWEGISNLCA